MLRLVVFATCLVGSLSVFNKLEWQDCGPADALIRFRNMDITPMPFRIPGKIKVTIDAVTTSTIGQASLDVKLAKGNLGGRFWWDMPCSNIKTNIQDLGTVYFGSCQYSSTCDFPILKQWTTSNNCPSFFAENNIECKCPLPPSALKMTNSEIDLTDMAQYAPDWLVAGDYSFDAILKHGSKIVGCLKAKVSLSDVKPCPEVLAKVNACPK